jgi:hypothetical protein
MVHELAEEGDPSGVCWVVSVVRAELGFSDETDGTDLKWVGCVHHSARAANLGQCLTEFLAGLSKPGEVEQATEPSGTVVSITATGPVAVALLAIVVGPVAVAARTASAARTTASTSSTNTAVFVGLRRNNRRCDHRSTHTDAHRTKKFSS